MPSSSYTNREEAHACRAALARDLCSMFEKLNRGEPDNWDSIGDRMRPLTTQVPAFRGSYNWLSNYYACNVEGLAIDYASVESGYLCQKYFCAERPSKLTYRELADWRRKEAPLHKQIFDWENKKMFVMAYLLVSKFDCNPGLVSKLLATGNSWIEETNNWNDTYWGVCNGKGQNRLGKLLMLLRNYYAVGGVRFLTWRISSSDFE